MSAANLTLPRIVNEAINRARADYAAGLAAWTPVFVELQVDGQKIGHMTSDGFTHENWDFYPVDAGRMAKRRKSFFDAIPKWAAEAELVNARTYRETYKGAQS